MKILVLLSVVFLFVLLLNLFGRFLAKRADKNK